MHLLKLKSSLSEDSPDYVKDLLDPKSQIKGFAEQK